MTPQGGPQAVVYGAGIQTPLQFAGELAPTDQATLGVGVSALYDDNVLGNNATRLADETLSFDSHLGLSRQTEHLAVSLDYMPFFVIYRTYNQFDKLNQVGNLDLTFRLTSRVVVRAYDSISYQNGIYPSLTQPEILSGPASPTSLNQFIVPYTTRALTNTTGLVLTFVKSRRTALTLTGGYNQSKFGQQIAGEPLYNTRVLSGGLTFQYLVTEHTNFGILLLHQDSTFQGGGILGNRLRSQIESAIFSVGSRLSPTLSISVFAGPQYVRSVSPSLTQASIAGNYQFSGGGSITKEVRNTAFEISLQRSVSDGGGLYPSVSNNRAVFGIRRRVVGQWEADVRGVATRADASLYRTGGGVIDNVIAGVDLHRSLSRGAVFHVSYNTLHQVCSRNLPFSVNFDRNQVAVGVDYQFKALTLGR
jgi:hypothetical protein